MNRFMKIIHALPRVDNLDNFQLVILVNIIRGNTKGNTKGSTIEYVKKEVNIKGLKCS